eukprot:m.245314 g.245314  ORF g.245314 m.245314 type:complete len:418 (-) comp26635_c0_seq7:244-1497(-)
MHLELYELAVVVLANLSDTSTADDCTSMPRTLLHRLWASVFASTTPLIAFYVEVALTAWATPRASVDSVPHRVEISEISSTMCLILSPDRLEARNDMWTFESAQATHTVNSAGCYYFETRIMTPGIVQVGWATPQCSFQPERGLGVGDDEFSCAYDGTRQRAWCARQSCCETHDNYGKPWKPGDVVGSVFNADEGCVDFFLNGEPLGRAFSYLDMTQSWCPAVSLSTNQQVRFNFGQQGFWCDVPVGAKPLLLPESTLLDVPIFLQEKKLLCDVSWPVDPIMYFEVMVHDVYGEEVGFASSNGLSFCVVPFDKQLWVQHEKLNHSEVLLTSVLGCGVAVDGTVFFTVDGHSLASGFATSRLSLFPRMTCARVRVNYGQARFVFEPFNTPDTRLQLGRRLLHKSASHSRSSSTASLPT